ncbi:hypothetical protein [Neobacillus niacini]|uniref:hypothetical protein n=1 Tax=Neobacillus niacini TaxID=86668 RepID=UPI00286355C2|nr:hypothetical protein [Neobacillus niacini]MDR7003015.1 hypothetical protein [Neobacillus niacini]
MKKLISTGFMVGICLLSSSPGLARENVSTTKIESPPEAPSNYVFKNPDAKAKASTGDFFREVSGKMQAIFKKYDEGEIDEAEVARLIKTEISPLLPNKEYEIALQLSERKARQGK